MKVIITGGAGFIGSHIVDAILRNGHIPFVIDNMSSGSRDNLPAGVKVYEADICDRDRIEQIFAEVKPDGVSHQAAQMSVSRSVREPHFDAENNVIGLINVLDAAVQHGAKRFVFASSGGVLYGDVTAPAKEDAPANPISPYGITKWVGEKYLQFYANEYGIDAVALRYANVFGERQNPHGEAGVVAIFSELMLNGKQAKINGDGRFDRDYVHVSDVAAANFLSLTAPLKQKFQAFNIGTGVKTDVNQLASKIRQECIRLLAEAKSEVVVPEPIHGPDRPGDLRSNFLDASMIGETFGWKPTIQVEEGLEKTVQWFANRVLTK
ncbi:NAD-dependent epimerase/dehydratase family protein [Planctomicrobium sp. SH668]|uniref:NAD-dependent epimerase/dehydratase family protein n=1 Tax=Planctomicrobium sp. SH668 TaxID=3448126 RepID=UPI003F5B6108